MSETIEKSKALKQIEEIYKVIESSNRLLFPAKSIFAIGLGVVLIPLIEYPTQILTFGYNFGEHHPLIVSLIHVVFYFFYFEGIRFLVSRRWGDHIMNNTHPLLKRALSLERPIIAAIVGTILVLIPIGQGHLAYPFVYVFLGILFNLYGRLSSRLVLYISWSYIVLGFIYAALSPLQNSEVWIPFNTYLGVTLMVMGYSARKSRTRN